MAKSFTIDLGATSAKCAFFEDGNIIADFVTKTEIGGDILENIYNYACEIAADANIDMNDLAFVGVAVCGLVDNPTGRVIFSNNLGWKDYPALEEMKRIFKTENAVVLNDAKAATFGEWMKSMEGLPKSMGLYTIGTGIGGGAIFNGELVFGDNTGLPSEPGHGGGFQDVIQCGCGLQGCIEPISSATGIERELNIAARTGDGALSKLFKENNERPLTIYDVKELFLAHEEETHSIFVKCLEPLAKSISVLIHFFDISVIVLGGGPSNLGEPLLDIVRDHLRKYTLPDFYRRLDIRAAELKSLVGAWGTYLYGMKMLNLK